MKDNKNKAIEIYNKIRRSWSINPITRIKQDVKKDNKKRRQNDKKIIKEGY